MPIHRLRLREATTSVSYADFKIEAPNAEAAAHVLQCAYQSARAQNVALIIVDDGQAHALKLEGISSVDTTFHLMDESGNKVADLLTPDEPSI